MTKLSGATRGKAGCGVHQACDDATTRARGYDDAMVRSGRDAGVGRALGTVSKRYLGEWPNGIEKTRRRVHKIFRRDFTKTDGTHRYKASLVRHFEPRYDVRPGIIHGLLWRRRTSP